MESAIGGQRRVQDRKAGNWGLWPQGNKGTKTHGSVRFDWDLDEVVQDILDSCSCEAALSITRRRL